VMEAGRRRRIVGVIGESQISNPEHTRLAEEVGALLAESGYILVCGGLTGVMEAACRGARSRGGITVGILPGVDITEANRYVDIPIATGAGQMRNVMIVLTAEALIAIGGGYGTLSEIGHALRAGKPVVGLRTWQAVRGGEAAPIVYVETAAEAVEAVRRILGP